MAHKVSITPQSYLPEIRISENDNDYRVITVQVLDDEGKAYQPPARKLWDGYKKPMEMW